MGIASGEVKKQVIRIADIAFFRSILNQSVTLFFKFLTLFSKSLHHLIQ